MVNRHLLYTFSFTSFLIEPAATTQLSERMIGPAYPSIVLPNDEKMSFQYERKQIFSEYCQRIVILCTGFP